MEASGRFTPFSARTALPREPNALAAAVAALRRQGRQWLDLTLGNPTEAELPYDAERIRAALGARGVVGYEPAPFGMRSARAAVAAELQRRATVAAEPQCHRPAVVAECQRHRV